MPRRQDATAQSQTSHGSHIGSGSSSIRLSDPSGTLSSVQGTERETTTASTASSWQLRYWLMHEFPRFIPFIGYHHVLVIIGCGPLLFFSLVLAGCTSAGTMQNLHVVSFASTSSNPRPSRLMANETLASLMFDLQQQVSRGDATYVDETRAGYFSICAKLRPGGWQCGIKAISDQVLSGVSDPLGLVNMAIQFRTKTINPALIIISLVLDLVQILLYFTYPGWHTESGSDGSDREVKPFPSKAVTMFGLLFSCACSIGLYVATVWQHIASAAGGASVQGLRYGLVEVGTGTAAATLAWLGVALSLICTAGIAMLISSISVLMYLADLMD